MSQDPVPKSNSPTSQSTAIIILVVMIIGIIASGLIAYYARTKPLPFTELYFENHQNLPEDVNLFENNNFSYTIKNNEETDKTYNLKTSIELYNIYDVTEGTYKCIQRRLPKIRLMWIAENETTQRNLSRFEKSIKKDERFKTVRTEYKDNSTAIIPWDEYYVQFTFKPWLPTGYLVAGFGDIKIIFDVYHNITYVENKDGVKAIPTEISSRSENDVLLHFTKNRVTVSYDGFEIAEIETETNARKIEFKQINNFFNVGKLSAYIDQPFSVTSPETIRDYKLDAHKLNDLKRDIEKTKKDQIDLYRTYYDQALYEKFSPILGLAPPTQEMIRTSTYIVSRDNESQLINWTAYELSFVSTIYEGRGQTSAMFRTDDGKDAFGFLFQESTGDAVFFEFINESRVKLTYDKRVKQLKRNKFVLIANDSNAKVYLNKELIFDVNTTRQLSNVNLTLASSRSIVQFSDVKVNNLNPSCKDPLYFGKCEKDYRLGSLRLAEQRKVLETTDSGLRPNIKEAIARLTEIGNINFSAFGKETENETQDFDFSEYLDQKFVYDLIAGNLSSYNPLIQDKKYKFNGELAQIYDWENYNFKAMFTPLDGALIIGYSFYDESGKEQFKFLLSMREDKAYLIINDEVKQTDINLSGRTKETMSMDYKYGIASFRYNYRNLLFEVAGLNISSGYFAFETYNTYITPGDLIAENKDTGEIKRFRVSEDPCQLRLVGVNVLRNENVTVKKDKADRFYESYQINRDFDFGMVSVNLTNANQSIHYWITNK